MSTFQKVVQDFDGSGDLAEAQREVVETLSLLAQTKMELFHKKINLLILDAGQGTNKTVPISSVVRSDGMTRAFTSSSAGDISQTLKDAVGGFIEGGTESILDGVFAILTKALEIFLGSASGSDEQIDQYFLLPTEFAIYRVDLAAWSRTIVAKSLKTSIQQATAYAYVMSNVNIDEISWSDFVAIYALQLDKMTNLTSEERAKFKQDMKDTWNFLKGDSAANALEAEPTSFAKIEATYQIPFTSTVIDIADED